jgi:hypothetical protein
VNPSDAILAEAREAIHAAAERVRAMPDLELVRLAMGGGAGVSDSTPEECADEGRAERVVAKPRTATRPKVSHNGLEGRQAQLYEIIKTNGPMRCGAIAKTIGISAGAVSGSMAPLMAKGLIEKEPGQLGAFRLAGTRQTGAKKTRKPPKGADEEEGAAHVKLSIVRPSAPVPPGPSARIAPVRQPSGVFKLPVLLRGPGVRRDDCTNYDGCLTRFCRVDRLGTSAHCPTGCSSFVPARRELAMAGCSPLALAF